MRTIEVTTATLTAPGATITYDVHGELGPHPLLLIGSPMDARGFPSLASHFTDRTLVTYDPRGVHRSTKAEGAPVENTPEDHAGDLHRIVEALGVGPVDVFASSGGAVNALALVAAHPEDVRTLVAHEPPAVTAVPDRDAALDATDDVIATYHEYGVGPGMAKFIALISHTGELTPAYLGQPAPDPAQYGLPTTDDGRRDDVMIAQNMRGCSHYAPDFAALAAAPTRIVVAAGVESAEQLAARCARGIADGLGVELTMFPSHHAGFLGGEFGQHGDPDAFAARLREVLAAG